MMGAIRREQMVEKITDEFTLEHKLDKRVRAALMGAVRIAMFEATRGCVFATSLDPSVREEITDYWGFSGMVRWRLLQEAR